jgi:hypothetical protein
MEFGMDLQEFGDLQIPSLDTSAVRNEADRMQQGQRGNYEADRVQTGE